MLQFSQIVKRENAHSESLWACAWGKFVPGAEVPNGNEENAPPPENLPDRLVLISYDQLLSVLIYILLPLFNYFKQNVLNALLLFIYSTTIFL